MLASLLMFRVLNGDTVENLKFFEQVHSVKSITTLLGDRIS